MTYKIIPVKTFDYFVFGATGDLAKRKLIQALFSRFIDGQIPESARIIGCSRSDFDTTSFRDLMKNVLQDANDYEKQSEPFLNSFLSLLFYQKIDITEDSEWAALKATYHDNEKIVSLFIIFLWRHHCLHILSKG